MKVELKSASLGLRDSQEVGYMKLLVKVKIHHSKPSVAFGCVEVWISGGRLVKCAGPSETSGYVLFTCLKLV